MAKALFPADYRIRDFSETRRKALSFLEASLEARHAVAMKNLESYRRFKPGTDSLDEIGYLERQSPHEKLKHSRRVAAFCAELAREEGDVSPEALEIAGLLHDVAYYACPYEMHADESARMAIRFLEGEICMSRDDAARFGTIIAAHYAKDPSVECFCCVDGISREAVLLIEADFLEKYSPRRGLTHLLECGRRGMTAEDAAASFERKMVTRAMGDLMCDKKSPHCACTESFKRLLTRMHAECAAILASMG